MYQFVIEEGRKEGLEKGLQEGLQQGLQQGVRQEAMTLLRRLLERRFGKLPEWVGQRIEAADQTTLEEWVLRVPEARSLEDGFG